MVVLFFLKRHSEYILETNTRWGWWNSDSEVVEVVVVVVVYMGPRVRSWLRCSSMHFEREQFF